MQHDRCPYCDDKIPAERIGRADLHGYCSHGCRLAAEMPLSNAGQTIISREGAKGQGCPLPELTAPDLTDDEATPTDAMMGRLAMFIAQFMALPSHTRDTVCYRYMDLCGDTYTYGDIGLVLGITAQACEARLNEAMRISPAIRAMFVGKVYKREVRQ